jgi:hypothetical protein
MVLDGDVLEQAIGGWIAMNPALVTVPVPTPYGTASYGTVFVMRTVYRYRTVPYRTIPYRSVPHRTCTVQGEKSVS